MVAAINGAAVGGGLTQVLPMDYLIASEQAKLSMRFVKMGLVPEGILYLRFQERGFNDVLPITRRCQIGGVYHYLSTKDQ